VVVADVVDHDYGGQTQPNIAGAVSGDDDHPNAPPKTAAGRAAVIAPRPPVAKPIAPQPEPPAKPRSRRRLFIASAVVALLALAGIGVGYGMIRNYYYVSVADGTVAIMRGIQGSILGVPLQEPYLLGCINDRGELSQISYGQAHSELGCDLMRVQDLRPSERAQVSAGLPAGSLDNAIGQMRELARSSLLPLCTPPAATRTTPTSVPRTGSGVPSAPPTSPAPPASPTSGAPTPAPPPPPPPVPQKPGTDCRTAA
jgi:hypothetical protein